ncbi:MAG TPA: S8 family serine peptidase [Nocardioides sp.]|nr:S8 family serine peptidase [Nocardioides sp.]
MARRPYVASAALLLLLAASLATTTTAPAPASATPSVRHACAASARWQCRAEVRTPDTSTSRTTARAARTAASGDFGYTAAQLQQIYRTAGISPADGTPTIAVVDAFDYPHAEGDLATYRSTMGLPACTVASGCLSIVNQDLGSTLPPAAPVSDDWTIESALDLDMASAVCPRCHLVLVEATTDADNGLVTGAVKAASLAHYVSMSWGGADDGSIATDTFAVPGTIYAGATGDNGHEAQPDVPDSLTGVVAVGGVSLASTTATPTAWSGAGSSCSTRVPKPAVQATLTTDCVGKATSDLSAIADPHTGMGVYDTSNGNGGWNEVGGTSAATPIIAALYAVAGNHTVPFAAYTDLARYPSLLEDVTSGSNSLVCLSVACVAGTGWDGPTGIGMPLTPEAVALPLARMHVAVARLVGRKGHALVRVITLPTSVPDTAGTRQALAHVGARVTGLPRGLHWSVSGTRLTIRGTPTRVGTGRARITLSGTTPAGRTAGGSTSFGWVIRRR